MFSSLGQTVLAGRVLKSEIMTRMNPLQLRKAGAIIENMQGADMSDESINHICQALFCDQSEADMKLAWGVFQKFPDLPEASIDAETFREVLPLLGEDVSGEEIDAMFKAADTDGSGLIEFPEFMHLIKGMNPIVPDDPDSALNQAKNMHAAATILDKEITMKLHPQTMRQGGIIALKMQGAKRGRKVLVNLNSDGFSSILTIFYTTPNPNPMPGSGYDNESINKVCKAILLDQNEDDMRQAWAIFVNDPSPEAIQQTQTPNPNPTPASNTDPESNPQPSSRLLLTQMLSKQYFLF